MNFSAINAETPKSVQLAMQKHIGMFLLVWPRKMNFDERIPGFFDVAARDNGMEVFANNMDAHISLEWNTRNPYCTFYKVNREGLGLCWLPDDPFWHNRIVFMDNNSRRFPVWSMIQQLTTPSGAVKDGNEVRMEIKCLEAELKEQVNIWKIVKNNQELVDFETKKEAEEYVETLKQPEIKADGDKGISIQGRLHGKIDIKEGFKLKYKKEIAELIRVERVRHEFGWTQCDEFVKHIAPRVMERVKNERAKMIAKSPDAFVITPDELVKLRNTAEWVNQMKASGLTPEKMAELAAKEKNKPVTQAPIQRFHGNKPQAEQEVTV